MKIYTIDNLFDVNEKLNLDFNFKKMFLEGYKITPKKTKLILYPIIVFFSLMGLLFLIGSVSHYLKYGNGLSIIRLFPVLFLIGISLTIYVGTAHHWYVINQKKNLNVNFSEKLTKKHPYFSFRQNSRKELYDWMLDVLSARYYIPSIRNEYNYQSKKIEISIGDVTKRDPGISSPSGAISESVFTAIFISFKKQIKPVKLLKTKEVLTWIKTNLNLDFKALQDYKLLLRVKNNYAIIEFENEIVSPQKKLLLLKYLKQQIDENIKNEPNSIDLKEINRLYNTNQQIGIKHCFKLFEDAQWNLSKIITYVKDNFTKKNPMHGYDFRIGETSFQVGPINYTYKIEIESESIEVHDDFTLMFFVDIVEETNTRIIEQTITSKSVAVFMYDNKDIPDFKTEIETHFNTHIKKLDLIKTNMIYSYLKEHYKSYFL